MVRTIVDDRLWVLESTDVAYACGVSDSGDLLHSYFGAPLAFERDYPPALSFPISVPFSGVAENSPEEYPSWSGAMYTEPCLRVSFPDGTRDVRTRYVGSQLSSGGNDSGTSEGDNDTLEIRLEDGDRGIRVGVFYHLHPESRVIERWAKITNAGGMPVRLDQVMSASLALPESYSYRISYLSGRWGAETQLHRRMLGTDVTVLESRRGHTSHEFNPWCALDPGGKATEESGEVYAVGLAHSGNWKIVVQQTPAGRTRLVAGIHDFDFNWELPPGDSFETPRLLLAFSGEGFGGTSRAFHRHIRKTVLPEQHRDELRPVLYNSWEATTFNVSEDHQIRLAKRAAELGAELFVVDDGWFGKRNDDTAGLGDWYVNPEKFPRGLGPVISAVREMGLRFGLWVEPEMVNPDSELYRKHPEWIYHFAGRAPTLMRNQAILNLGRPDVQEFVISFMDRLLAENRIDFIKWDMNRTITEPAGLDLPAERQREVWVRHVQGLYRAVEEIRRKHPDVIFEDCSGGGGRVDPGILRLFDQVWVSDNTDAYDRLFIQEGYSQVYPANTMVSWVTSTGGPLGQRQVPLEYRFHSSMTGVLGIGDDILSWSDEECRKAASLIAEYKEIRTVVQRGEQYRILSPAGGAVAAGTTAVAYVSPDREEAVLFAYRNGPHFRNPMPVIRVPGLAAEALYTVKGAEPATLSGDALRRVGIRLNLIRDYDSLIVRFRRAQHAG